MADNEMLIDVDIPLDIDVGFDADGLPKVVPATTRKKVEAAPPTTVPKADFETVMRERDAERAARTEAERKAKEAEDAARGVTTKLGETTVQAYGAHYARVSGELQTIKTAIANTEALGNAAERELAAAEAALGASTDPAERADLATRKAKAQRELSRAEAELVTLQSGQSQAEHAVSQAKRYWEDAAASADAAKAAAATEPKTKEPDKPKQMTPEEWIESCPSATRPWLREHREYATDEKLHRKLRRFAEDYMDDHGKDSLDSADFVSALNDKFFPKGGDDVVNQDDDSPAAAEPRRSAPAAPVSRGSNSAAPNGGEGGGGKVRLSAMEQNTAISMYPDMDRTAALKKYATNKARAIKDGLYSPRG